MHQSEQTLEQNLINQLKELGYTYVNIPDESVLLSNLKTQLEKFNKIKLTEKEYSKILNHLNKGNVFDRAKTLRDRYALTREDGTTIWIRFLNTEKWCQNEYQVTNQVTMEGKYKNRYDVTILVNGLPLVQIELKRRGLELKEAFNQVNRYHRISFGTSYGLYQYVQIFVISNGVNTKYYANNRYQSFQQTFTWADKHNKKLSNLNEFTENFLEPCHLSKMISRYIVLAETEKILMVLRPYQYYAVEELIEKVKTSNKNGYIWHTTGSGKTLTSFKASQIITSLPEVHKVLFVVDRRDLDYQTTKEFNNFSAGSVDGTDNTNALVKQFSDDTKLIVTTIQKLNNAISNKRHLGKMEHLKDKKMVFIFDECHRNQFGETHQRIKEYFNNTQMFGFTGTPIFAENAIDHRTTKDLFGECLHKYVITDAIRDQNVLKFSVEYVGRYKQKDESKNEIDIEVEDIDTKELMESDDRIEKIADYVIANHDRKTHAKEFTSIFCTSSVDMVIKYYDIFRMKKARGEHNLRMATIFTYGINEEDKEANGYIPDDLEILESEIRSKGINYQSREKLEDYIKEYNSDYGTNFSTDSRAYYNYYRDIARRVKNREIDILFVVNMFLTGFDSKPLNTLYVDKNLRYHGLIQAYSRTNRILNTEKSHGNIVCFRNLKKATDQALKLYSNKEAKEVVFMEPYEDYVKMFNEQFQKLKEITPTVSSVDELINEEEDLKFVKAFRELIRSLNILKVFSDFTFEDLDLDEQEFEDYKSKYLDMYDRTTEDKEKVSVLDDVDFEVELIHRDEINVAYILKLLAQMMETEGEKREKIRKEVEDLLSGQPQLRSKKELIQQFIEDTLLNIEDIENVDDKFYEYWDEERIKAFNSMCLSLNLDPDKTRGIIDKYLFTEREPRGEDIVSALKIEPKILERRSIIDKATDKILEFIDIFIEGL
ncbi:MAG: type 1 restriction enzyme [candidate division WS6 bacterium 34_10]|uniref:Type I restriction enzyme endonuclease subunit n=1 Tax=candidate division WS6 bacterium 34_10 TaxID=1641389 RepID=A0A101HJ06_9BACT|nr:MAG: type 1 restriction enzyme [candidate division WS6 bacterium 34_10]